MSTKKVVGVYNVGTSSKERDELPPKPEGATRFVCLSDTHEKLGAIHIPPGDVILHAGDFTFAGQPGAVERFNAILGTLPHPHKVVIAGNHDITFHEEFYERKWSRWHHEKFNSTKVKQSLTNCIYLEDSHVNINGINIYGSPWQPAFCDWAFNLHRGEPLRKVWSKIPETTDILMTHGPPLGHGDITRTGEACGCADLLVTIKRIQPAAHIFGHIHEAYGVSKEGKTVCINASNCNLSYAPLNNPVVFDVI